MSPLCRASVKTLLLPKLYQPSLFLKALSDVMAVIDVNVKVYMRLFSKEREQARQRAHLHKEAIITSRQQQSECSSYTCWVKSLWTNSGCLSGVSTTVMLIFAFMAQQQVDILLQTG